MFHTSPSRLIAIPKSFTAKLAKRQAPERQLCFLMKMTCGGYVEGSGLESERLVLEILSL